MDNVSRDGNSNKESKRNARDKRKTSVTEVKNAFNGLIDRLNMAEEKLSELEDMTIEIAKPKSKQKKDRKR